MFVSRITRRAIPFIAWLIVAFSVPVVFAQEDKDKKEKLAPPDSPAVLWRQPSDISSEDLFLGPGGDELKPDLSNVTFEKEDTTGYSVKYQVRDGAGRKWVAKIGNEARPETAAVRLLWAVGYVTEINYLAPCAHIKGAPKPRKNVERCEGDGFADVRFEARPDNVKRLENWDWKSNPFADTKELNGLVVLMALLNNWDLKNDNNKILLVKSDDGTAEQRYIISDLGATFGKTGGAISHSRNEPEKYVKTKFVERVKGDRVQFAFSGKQGELLGHVTVEQAKWIGSLLAQLSDQQLQDAFRAANFPPEEIQMLTQAVRDRINQLTSLQG
ncbi:MAG: hypothetical protein QOH41_1340 [Blastocatellia bacterium]|jgi:hypothetical protein|nr:hypothetical protein [Blastocatellia bacterium]